MKNIYKAFNRNFIYSYQQGVNYNEEVANLIDSFLEAENL